MSNNNKVIWSEGMFLRPQHFQQQDRYVEHRIETRCRNLIPYSWGVTELVLDEQLLLLGKFCITKAKGIFPDGTPFDIPEQHSLPEPLEITNDIKNATVYLALPGVPDNAIHLGESANGTERYLLQELESKDSYSRVSSGTAPIEAGSLNTSIRYNRQDLGAYSCLPIAVIIEKRADNQVILDEEFIASCLTTNGSQILADLVEEIHGLLHHRAESLAERLGSPGAGGVAEVADFLLLQIVNRFESLFQHLSALTSLHPESLFRTLLEIAGELATITSTNRRPSKFPIYQHDDLASTFVPLILEIKRSLNWVPDLRAVPIPLEEHQHGIRTAAINDQALLKSADFVLAVNAQISTEKLQQEFPRQTTIATVEKLRDFVMSRVTGVNLRTLPVAPRQIPYHSGFTYFQLEKHGSTWEDLTESGAMAMHISGEYPGLEIEFWAIKG